MKKLGLLFLFLLLVNNANAQSNIEAINFIESYKSKYQATGAYKVIVNQTIVNESVGINEETQYSLTVDGDKYRFENSDTGIKLITNGKVSWSINDRDREIQVNDSVSEGIQALDPMYIYNEVEERYAGIFLAEGENLRLMLYPKRKYKELNNIRLIVVDHNADDKSIKYWRIVYQDGTTFYLSVDKMDHFIQVNNQFFNVDHSDYPEYFYEDLRN
ncbi:hypothetical protein AB2B38_013605 [Balneola sp. MJW-20]|uniref:hypothetical protein n=1 Tax=Gracilimonas aurantiaca TaxID=3234185 RepID=UPI003467E6F3